MGTLFRGSLSIFKSKSCSKNKLLFSIFVLILILAVNVFTTVEMLCNISNYFQSLVKTWQSADLFFPGKKTMVTSRAQQLKQDLITTLSSKAGVHEPKLDVYFAWLHCKNWKLPILNNLHLFHRMLATLLLSRLLYLARNRLQFSAK